MAKIRISWTDDERDLVEGFAYAKLIAYDPDIFRDPLPRGALQGALRIAQLEVLPDGRQKPLSSLAILGPEIESRLKKRWAEDRFEKQKTSLLQRVDEKLGDRTKPSKPTIIRPPQAPEVTLIDEPPTETELCETYDKQFQEHFQEAAVPKRRPTLEILAAALDEITGRDEILAGMDLLTQAVSLLTDKVISMESLLQKAAEVKTPRLQPTNEAPPLTLTDKLAEVKRLPKVLIYGIMPNEKMQVIEKLSGVVEMDIIFLHGNHKRTQFSNYDRIFVMERAGPALHANVKRELKKQGLIDRYINCHGGCSALIRDISTLAPILKNQREAK